jgi:hypothetical protein
MEYNLNSQFLNAVSSEKTEQLFRRSRKRGKRNNFLMILQEFK